MSKKAGNRQATVDESNGKARAGVERADFVSTATGHSSYMERNWARVQEWAAVERPDLHPAPVLTPKAKQIVHRFTLTPAARRLLAQERDHAADQY